MSQNVRTGNSREMVKSGSDWNKLMGDPRILNGLKTTLPAMVSQDRFLRQVTLAAQRNPKIMDCTTPSIVATIMRAAEYGVNPSGTTGEAYLIPRWGKNALGKGKGGYELSFLLGYRGMLALVHRHGAVHLIDAGVIYKNDKLTAVRGPRGKFEHEPTFGSRGELVGSYCWWTMPAAPKIPLFVLLTKDDIERRRERSESRDSDYSPWNTDYDAMARKSAVRAAWSMLPWQEGYDVPEELDDDDVSARIGRAEALNVGATGPVERDPPKRKPSASDSPSPGAGTEDAGGDDVVTTPIPPAGEDPPKEPRQKTKRRRKKKAAEEAPAPAAPQGNVTPPADPPAPAPDPVLIPQSFTAEAGVPIAEASEEALSWFADYLDAKRDANRLTLRDAADLGAVHAEISRRSAGGTSST